MRGGALFRYDQRSYLLAHAGVVDVIGAAEVKYQHRGSVLTAKCRCCGIHHAELTADDLGECQLLIFYCISVFRIFYIDFNKVVFIFVLFV